MRFRNKIALITGAGGVIGTAVALRLGSEECTIAAIDISEKSLRELEASLKKLNISILCFQADITDSIRIQKIVQTVLDRYGKIDILINIAGGPSGSGHGDTAFYQKDEDLWNRVIDVNLKGTIICTQSVLATMMDAKQGKIVSISSIDGLSGSGDLGKCDYSAAKAGIIGFTKSLAKEVGKNGINVNCVSLGQFANGKEKDNKSKNSWEIYGRDSVLERFGEPAEAAGLIAYLASDEAGYITGQNYIIGGGCYM